MQISKKKLADLHAYFTDGGSTEPEDVANFLGTDSEDTVEAYVASLKRKYPAIYGGSEDETEPVEHLLIDTDTGITKLLELVKQKGPKQFFQVVEPKELVTIRVGGEDIEVDLIKLRKKNPNDKLGNHLVSTLIVAAELAKA